MLQLYNEIELKMNNNTTNNGSDHCPSNSNGKEKLSTEGISIRSKNKIGEDPGDAACNRIECVPLGGFLINLICQLVTFVVLIRGAYTSVGIILVFFVVTTKYLLLPAASSVLNYAEVGRQSSQEVQGYDREYKEPPPGLERWTCNLFMVFTGKEWL